jgi:hypothetical protein
MGEERKPNPRARWVPRHASARTTPKKEKFKAPTPGLENQVFKVGGAEDAAAFAEITKALARYANANFKVGAAMAVEAIEDRTSPDLTPPGEAPDPAEALKFKLWEIEVEDWGKKKRAWDDAQPRAFQLILSHCEPTVIDKLEASSKWATTKKDQNVIELLTLIQGITQKHDEVKQGTMAFVEQLFDWCLRYQKEGEDLSDFYKSHKSGGEIIDSFGGMCGYHPVVIGQHKDKLATKLSKATHQLTDEEENKAIKSACEEFKACAFIKKLNDKVHGDLKREMEKWTTCICLTGMRIQLPVRMHTDMHRTTRLSMVRGPRDQASLLVMEEMVWPSFKVVGSFATVAGNSIF